jgi:hypothetical protein
LHTLQLQITGALDHDPTINAPEPMVHRLRESPTMLQKALRRAAKIAPMTQIAVTAPEEYWEPSTNVTR